MKLLGAVLVALAGVLILVVTGAVVRGRVRELKEHVAHCREMCGPGQTIAEDTARQETCRTGNCRISEFA